MTFCCRNAGTPAARLPRPATSGWPLQRLASPPQGAGQNAGGQGPKAARDGEQASRGSPRVAQRGMAAIVRGSPCFRQPSMAAGSACRLPLSTAAPVFVSLAWLRGLRDRARVRPSAQVPKGPRPSGPRAPGPQAPAPSASACGLSRVLLGRRRTPAWWPNRDAP